MPALEPDGGTAVVLALDFVQAAAPGRGLWAKPVQCVDDATQSEVQSLFRV